MSMLLYFFFSAFSALSYCQRRPILFYFLFVIYREVFYVASVILDSLVMATQAVILVTCAPMVLTRATRMHGVPKLVRDDSNAGYDNVNGLLLLVLC